MDLYRAFGAVGLLGILSLAVLTGSPLIVFYDLPSILFTGVGGVAAWLATSGRGVNAVFTTLRAPQPSKSELATGLHTVRAGRRAFWLVGVLGTLIGAVQMLQSIDDPAAIGPALAVGLLTLVYAFLANIFLINPLEHRILAKQCVQSDSEATPQLAQQLDASHAALNALRQRVRDNTANKA